MLCVLGILVRARDAVGEASGNGSPITEGELVGVHAGSDEGVRAIIWEPPVQTDDDLEVHVDSVHDNGKIEIVISDGRRLQVPEDDEERGSSVTDRTGATTHSCPHAQALLHRMRC